MADRVLPGPVDSAACIREAVCVHTKKIFDSCRDKDCIEDLRVYPTVGSQTYIDNAFSVRPKSAELLYAEVNVEAITFNKGYYTVDVTYFYKITGETFPGANTVTGLAIFDKRVMLCGGEGTVKTFSSDICDCSCVDEGMPTAYVEAVDPIADIDAIDYELILSDLEVVQNRADRMAKAAKSGNNKGAAAEAAWLQQLAAHLESGKPARSFDFDENDAEQQTVLHEMGLLSAKPVLYACNVGEDDLMEGIENNKYVPLVAARAKEEGARYIPICAKTEEDIADYSPEEKKAFLAEMGIEASGLDNLITASYDLLGLISFLTDGKKECRAWTIRKGTKAPQAAGKIHSDFERGFIRASVIAYSDLEAHDFDYAAVKAKGLQRTEGKEYVVKDGDVIEFLFNV